MKIGLIVLAGIAGYLYATREKKSASAPAPAPAKAASTSAPVPTTPTEPKPPVPSVDGMKDGFQQAWDEIVAGKVTYNANPNIDTAKSSGDVAKYISDYQSGYSQLATFYQEMKALNPGLDEKVILDTIKANFPSVS